MRTPSVLMVIAVLLLGGVREAGSSDPAPAPSAPRRVVLLYDFPRATPAIVAHEQAFTQTLKSTAGVPVNVYVDYLNLTLTRGAFPVETVDYLGVKYVHTSPDLVVAVGSTTLRFVLAHRARLFPGVRIAFTAADQAAVADVALPSDVAGIWLSIDWKGTYETALRLQPDVNRVVVVTGVSPIDRVWMAAARAQLEQVRGARDLVFLQGPSLESVMEQVAAFSARTIVLLGPFIRDATGKEFSGADASTRIAAASKVPVYTVASAMIGSGVVGGHVVSFEAHGREGGRLAASVLDGSPRSPHEAATNVPTFDARQLRRWGLDARRLPPASVILFDEPTLWTRYRHYIYLGAAIVAVQSVLIVTLLVQRSKRRRAEEALAGRLRFETLLADLSAVFVSRAGEDVNQHIQSALRRIGDELGIDRVTVGELVAQGAAVHVTHSWVREGTAPLPTILDPSHLSWVVGRVRQRESVYVSRHADLPAEADADRRTMTALGTRSLAVLPLVIGGSVTGLLALAVTRGERHWSSDLASRFTLLAEVFAGALARQRAEQAMEEARHHREEIAHVQRVTMLGELTAALAHELSQPLSAIVMNAQAADRLLRDAASGRDKVREALADICTESQRAMRVFKGIRALFRKERAAYGTVSMNALVEEVAGLLRGELQLKGIALEVALDPEGPRLFGDAVQLQQVLLNLLINAAEAIRAADGGPREITVTTAHRPSDLHVTVRDTGVGVPEAKLEQIFTRFVSDKPGGLGMGLTICRSIVQQHGGQIWATRNPGRGLTVHIELPLAQAPAAVGGPL